MTSSALESALARIERIEHSDGAVLVDGYRAGDVAELAAVMYAQFHCRAAEPERVSDSFAQRLVAANSTQPCSDDGWLVCDVMTDGSRLIRKGDTTYLVSPGEFVSSLGPGARANRGAIVSLFCPAGTFALQQGYFYAFGATPEGRPDEYARVRFYWNVTADSAPDVVRELTARLNAVALPFRLKCASSATSLARADSLVLFVRRQHYRVAASIVSRAHDAIDSLGDATPLFARRLGPGLALADDLGNADSFGMSRCKLLAAAVMQNPERKAVETFFRSHGVEPQRLHLRAGARADYVYPPFAAAPAGRRQPPQETGLVAEAARIAGRLCQDAIWSDGRCIWMTQTLGDLSARPTGPTLYDGTAGVALFLAAAHRVCGIDVFAHVARAAARQTMQRLDAEPRWGRQAGDAGIAWAMMHIAKLLDEQEWLDAARDIITELARRDPSDAPTDVVGGLAGTASALSEVGAALDHGPAMEAAVRFADLLAQRARRHGDDVSWETLPGLGPAQVHLLGAAHGASGIAAALARVATHGDNSFDALTAGALRYEQSWSVRCAGMWPDLRGVTDNAAASAPCGGTWCHGSAGAGLARLALIEHDADRDALLPRCVEASEHALAILAGPSDKLEDASPCHGAAGAGELLLELWRHTRERRHLDAARDLARRRIAEQGGPVHRWGCGIPGARTAPGLMIGLAGIGLFLLRCADPSAAPSPLLP